MAAGIHSEGFFLRLHSPLRHLTSISHPIPNPRSEPFFLPPPPQLPSPSRSPPLARPAFTHATPHPRLLSTPASSVAAAAAPPVLLPMSSQVAPASTTPTHPATTDKPRAVPDASDVAQQFITQYYTLLHQDPNQLYRLYFDRSTLLFGEESDPEAVPVYGTAAIKQAIAKLSFDNCKVCVSNYDGQLSANNGILIQVLGELCSNGGPWRRFSQTFFLADEGGRYWILNDMFRYLKSDLQQEELAEEVDDALDHEVDQAEHEGHLVKHDVDITSAVQSLQNANNTALPEPKSEPAAVEGGGSADTEAPSAEPAPSATASGAPAVAAAAVSPRATETTEDSSKPSAQDTTSSQDAAAAAASEQSSKLPSDDVQKASKTTPAAAAAASQPDNKPSSPNGKEASAPAAAAAASATPAPQETKPSKPRSWANLAASNLGKWGSAPRPAAGNAPSKPATTPAAAPAKPTAPSSGPATGSTTPTPTTSAPAPPSASAAAPGGKPKPAANGPPQRVPGASVSVRHVEKFKPDTLRSAVAQFGTVLNVNLLPAGRGYVDFSSPEEARAAIAYSDEHDGVPVDLGSGVTHTIRVLAKAPAPPKPRNAPGLGRGGAQGGRRGGRGGGQTNQAGR